MGGRGANFKNISSQNRAKCATINGGIDEVAEELGLEREFAVMRTLSAMAKQFYVKVQIGTREETWKIKEGTKVTGINAMAVGEKIRDVKRLVDTYKKSNGEKTNPKDWIKARGTAILTDGEQSKKAEIHWYQCKDIGKVEFKRKRWYDEG